MYCVFSENKHVLTLFDLTAIHVVVLLFTASVPSVSSNSTDKERWWTSTKVFLSQDNPVFTLMLSEPLSFSRLPSRAELYLYFSSGIRQSTVWSWRKMSAETSLEWHWFCLWKRSRQLLLSKIPFHRVTVMPSSRMCVCWEYIAWVKRKKKRKKWHKVRAPQSDSCKVTLLPSFVPSQVGIVLHYSSMSTMLWLSVTARNIYKQVTKKPPQTQDGDPPAPPKQPLLR